MITLSLPYLITCTAKRKNNFSKNAALFHNFHICVFFIYIICTISYFTISYKYIYARTYTWIYISHVIEQVCAWCRVEAAEKAAGSSCLDACVLSLFSAGRPCPWGLNPQPPRSITCSRGQCNDDAMCAHSYQTTITTDWCEVELLLVKVCQRSCVVQYSYTTCTGSHARRKKYIPGFLHASYRYIGVIKNEKETDGDHDGYQATVLFSQSKPSTVNQLIILSLRTNQHQPLAKRTGCIFM
jgi:hypothetical protein